MKEKSYFREKLVGERALFSLSDELGFCKGSCSSPLCVFVQTFPDTSLVTFLIPSLLCCLPCCISALFYVMHLFVLAAGVQSLGRHKDDRKQSASSSHRGRHCCECGLLLNCGWVMLLSLILPLLINQLIYGKCSEGGVMIWVCFPHKNFEGSWLFQGFFSTFFKKSVYLRRWDNLISRVYWEMWHHLEIIPKDVWCSPWTDAPI